MHSKNASIRCYGLRSMVKAANGLIIGDRRSIAKIFAIMQYKIYAGTLQQYSSQNKVPTYTYLFPIIYCTVGLCKRHYRES